jgi:hypothetical protein
MPVCVLPRPRAITAWRAVAAIIFVLLWLAGETAAAQVRNLFEVTNVRVDEQAESAEAARQKALAAGERQAFEILLERITTPEDRARLANTPQTAIQALIKDFWISEEKASRVRYIAVLNFNFRPPQVRELLRRTGVAFSTQPAPPAVIVPVLRSEAGALLWEEENPWRAAWLAEAGTPLRPLRLPGAAASLVSVEQAIAGDAALLSRLAANEAAGEAIVAIAEIPPPPPDQPLELRVSVNRLGQDGRIQTLPIVLRGRLGEEATALLKRGAREVALQLDASWKGQTRITPKPTQVSAVEVPVADLADWLAIRRKMNGIAAIEGVNVVLYARNRVRINLVYGSKVEDLVNGLRAAGLALTTEEEPWTLRRAPSTPSESSVADPAAAVAVSRP